MNIIFKVPSDFKKKHSNSRMLKLHYCYLHGRSMRTSNFQGIKKNAESKHSSVTVIDPLMQFAKQLGTLDSINVIAMSSDCL